MAGTRDFLGTGWTFPPRVDSATGRFKTSSEEENIRQSVRIILTTRCGERAMRPDFGCNLHDYIFELPDQGALTRIRAEVVEALTLWEPRILDIGVEVDLEHLNQGQVWFNVHYTVRSTNNPNNLVFPYYLYEGIGDEM
ncbi:GPW/gp25 family protein [uncultured Ruthenibacterium sp.]|uniref:GPW/gp25 family protein n=1 Tax=uncultured Ruthenibacterium sp. TaxID=1905347 RepID=UPI00349E8606